MSNQICKGPGLVLASLTTCKKNKQWSKGASFEGTPKASQICSRHKVQLVGRVTLSPGPKSLGLCWLQDADMAARAQHSPEIHNVLTVMVVSCGPGHYGLWDCTLNPPLQSRGISTRQRNQLTAHQRVIFYILCFLFFLTAESQACHPCKWHQENTTRFAEDPRDNLCPIAEKNYMLNLTPKLILQMIFYYKPTFPHFISKWLHCR